MLCVFYHNLNLRREKKRDWTQGKEEQGRQDETSLWSPEVEGHSLERWPTGEGDLQAVWRRGRQVQEEASPWGRGACPHLAAGPTGSELAAFAAGGLSQGRAQEDQASLPPRNQSLGYEKLGRGGCVYVNKQLRQQLSLAPSSRGGRKRNALSICFTGKKFWGHCAEGMQTWAGSPPDKRELGRVRMSWKEVGCHLGPNGSQRRAWCLVG